MREFGWTIDYVLGLTFPVFFDLFGLIRRIRMDAAIDEFYTPYAAVKLGGKYADNLFGERGSVIITDDYSINHEITAEELENANRKLLAIINAQQNKLDNILET